MDQGVRVLEGEKVFEASVGGKNVYFKTGRLAGQAHGACTVQMGGTVVLATVVMSAEPREGVDFFPLMVDYEERLYAAGIIKGSRWIKREGRPSDEATLSARLIDRSIRPLFPENLKNDIQVIVTVLSVDGENDSDIAGLLAASAALAISPVPWNGPIGGIRVAQIPSEKDPDKKEWAINPTFAAREKCTLDMVVAGTYEKVLMIEANSHETKEDEVFEGIQFCQKYIGQAVKAIEAIAKEIGQEKKMPMTTETVEGEDPKESEKEVMEKMKKWADENVPASLFSEDLKTKDSRKGVIKELTKTLIAFLESEGIGKERRKKAAGAFYVYVEEIISKKILEEEKRVDGRSLEDIRELSCDAQILPRTHGSGLFSRGQTQVLSVVTLGAPGDEQLLEGIEESGKKRYMHHYNFPKFSVGESGPMRSPGRREIGHGALAERAILPMLPEKEKFPYTIRVVSEVLSSNGSSSMGAVCGSTLALMDAGVPLKKPVAGIAMGLASNEKGEYKVLTDLQDLEDGPGGMDFKVAGTRDGITVIQLDTKTDGLSLNICKETLEQAKKARLEILDAIEKCIPAPREEMSPYAPRILTLLIDPAKIREVIGPGGKIINDIIDKTEAQIDIEQDGMVYITAMSEESGTKALDMVKNIVREILPGEIFEGKVIRIMDFGAIVELTPGKDGMVHISELDHRRVNAVEDVLHIGDTVRVKVMKVEDNGKISLSRKELIPRPEGMPHSRDDGRRDRPDNRRNFHRNSR